MSDGSEAVLGAAGCGVVAVLMLAAAFASRGPAQPRRADVLGVLVEVSEHSQRAHWGWVKLENTTPYQLTVRTVRRTSGGEHGEDGWRDTLTVALEPGEAWQGEAQRVDEVRVYGHPALPAAVGDPR